jgi:dephospho-CoA kinase
MLRVIPDIPDPASRPLVIGLVGGIGSGKSQVASLLAAHGAQIIHADQLGHEALRDSAVREKVVAAWGDRILDGTGVVDRRALGAIVFTDPEERRRLEGIVHPWITARALSEVRNACAEPEIRLIVLDAPVLLEAGWGGYCDRLLFVDVPEEIRLRRLAETRGWTPQEVRARESAQLPLTEKRVRADDVVDNSASLDELERQVGALLLRWKVAPRESAPRVGC